MNANRAVPDAATRNHYMPALLTRPLSLLIVIGISGVAGFFSAAALCGIGMCTFVPLTPAVVLFSSLVASDRAQAQAA